MTQTSVEIANKNISRFRNNGGEMNLDLCFKYDLNVFKFYLIINRLLNYL